MNIISIINEKMKLLKWERAIKKKNVRLVKPYNITNYENIYIGEKVYIGPEAFIMAKGGLSIGNNVIIGPKLTVWTENHNFKSMTMIPYDKEDILKPVNIEPNVWIGLGVILCPGTEIGEGSIIGMGTVVRGKIPPLSIAIGNPSQIIGKRDENMYFKLIKEQKIFTWRSR